MAISAGAGWLVWDYGFKDNPGYPVKVMKQATELQGRILSFDSHITVPLSFGAHGNEADKDGSGQFDLIKANRGRLSGAALTVFGWPEMWNGPNAPHRPTDGFVEEARNQQEVRYKIISGLVRDFSQSGRHRLHPPTTSGACTAKASLRFFISMLNAYPLGNDLSKLDLWAARGMRMFGFSYIGNNSWADSSRPLPFFSTTPPMPSMGCRTSANKRCNASTIWA
ncbi:membrane dipeptidase [Pseudomonas lini]